MLANLIGYLGEHRTPIVFTASHIQNLRRHLAFWLVRFFPAPASVTNTTSDSEVRTQSQPSTKSSESLGSPIQLISTPTPLPRSTIESNLPRFTLPDFSTDPPPLRYNTLFGGALLPNRGITSANVSYKPVQIQSEHGTFGYSKESIPDTTLAQPANLPMPSTPTTLPSTPSAIPATDPRLLAFEAPPLTEAIFTSSDNPKSPTNPLHTDTSLLEIQKPPWANELEVAENGITYEDPRPSLNNNSSSKILSGQVDNLSKEMSLASGLEDRELAGGVSTAVAPFTGEVVQYWDRPKTRAQAKLMNEHDQKQAKLVTFNDQVKKRSYKGVAFTDTEGKSPVAKRTRTQRYILYSFCFSAYVY